MDNRADLWADRALLRDVQYQTDANLAAGQSIYAYQHPPIDLPARVLELGPASRGVRVRPMSSALGAGAVSRWRQRPV